MAANVRLFDIMKQDTSSEYSGSFNSTSNISNLSQSSEERNNLRVRKEGFGSIDNHLGSQG
jgi:hypothetical protein